MAQSGTQQPGAHLCFDAQQAAEKAIKAVLLHRAVDFPYVHDLDKLLGTIEGSELTEDDHSRAVEIATAVVVWARSVVGYQG